MRGRDELTLVVDDKEKLARQLDHNPGNKTSALETLGQLDVDRAARTGRGTRSGEVFDPGPIDLADLPPLPGDLPPIKDVSDRADPRSGEPRPPPDLKRDRSDALPSLPDRPNRASAHGRLESRGNQGRLTTSHWSRSNLLPRTTQGILACPSHNEVLCDGGSAARAPAEGFSITGGARNAGRTRSALVANPGRADGSRCNVPYRPSARHRR